MTSTSQTAELPEIPSDLPLDQALSYDPGRSLLLSRLADSSLQPTVRLSTDVSAAAPEGSEPSSPTPAEATRPALHGGEFHLAEKIAQGGFGDVWSAWQAGLEREIAVKRLRADRLSSTNPEQRQQMLEMFRREAITTAHLEHPNVVPVYHLDTDTDGHWLLGMKRVRGRPWNELLKEDRGLRTDEFLARHLPILIDVAQAVAFAHSRGILHRDLKPQQVMVGEFGEVQLMDWGLAAAFDASPVELPASDPREPESGSFASSAAPGPAGTPSYMAPEQTRGEPEALGPWTDLYLLGGILYFLLTGSAPHRARDGVAAFVKASKGAVVDPAERAPELRPPEELCRIAMAVLAPDPESRHPASVPELITALEGYLSGATRRRRSRELISEVETSSGGTRSYETLSRQLASLRRAAVLWPENPRIEELRTGLQADYVSAALEHDDLALARLYAEQLPRGPLRDDLSGRVDAAIVQRRRQAGQRRLALWGLLVTGLVLLWTAFQHNLDQERAAEELREQRDAARLARAEAESLTTFMLHDLWQRLQAIQRVDLMTPVARRVERYYLERDPEEMTVSERINRGMAFQTVGEALRYQGEMEDASAAFGLAVGELTELLAEDPEDPEISVLLLDSLLMQASCFSDLGAQDRALEVFDRVRREVEAARTYRPEDPELQKLLLEATDGAGIIHYDRGRMDTAQEHFSKALAIAEELIRLDPESVDRVDLSLLEFRVGATRIESGRLEPGLVAVLSSLETLDRFHEENPEKGELQSLLGLVAGPAVDALVELGRPGEAVELGRRYLAPALEQADSDPENAEHLYSAASLLLALGQAEEARGRTTAARSLYEEAAARIAPRIGQTDNLYLLDTRVRALLALGRVDSARPTAESMLSRGWQHRDFVALCRAHGIERPAGTVDSSETVRE